MDLKHKGIGIFDSGLGGLTVLNEIKKRLPNERLIYIGDTARVPYGNRSPSTVIRYSLENSSFLVKKGIKLLVVACNTASALSLNILKKRLSIPIIGVIEPGAIKAVKITRNKKIGVIGTTGTINSGAYVEIINRIDSHIEVYSKACPLFVPLAEEGLIDDSIALEIARRYLKELKEKDIDTLILGCTHYPILKRVIKKVMDNINLVDSAEEVANLTYSLLYRNSLLNDNKGSLEIYVTDLAPQFIEIGKRFLGMDIKDIKRVELDEERF
jgi:glutamate racemase